MTISLKNDDLTITVEELGAELINITGGPIEYLFWADPAFWDHCAPILFPVVGPLKDGSYTLDGQTYKMPEGGFAIGQTFEVVEQDAEHIRLRLTDNDETRKIYPRAFQLDVDYRLAGMALTVGLEVTNTGDKALPFSLAGQPGISCVWFGQDVVTDYIVEFPKEEKGECPWLKKGLITPSTRPVLSSPTTLELDGLTFDDDAMVFSDLQSTSVKLKHRSRPMSVTVDFEGFPQLILWALPISPYICMSPSFGHPDAVDAPSELGEKPGVQTLDPGGVFSCSYRMTVGE